MKNETRLKNTTPPLVARVISETAKHAKAASDHAKKSCAEALLAGLRLVWLKRETVSMGGDRKSENISVPRGTLIGFRGAVEKIGIPKTTAYRWMTAAGRALVTAGALTEDDGPEMCPEPGSDEWREWENLLVTRAKGMSISRLQVGHSAANTDFHRLEELFDGVERGDDASAEMLEAVEAGRLTLAQAIRAAGGKAATQGKRRADPVYLAIDGRTGGLKGLVPKALVTLGNAFGRWEDLDSTARRECRSAWGELVSHLPEELR